MQEDAERRPVEPVYGGEALQPPYDPVLADLLQQQVEGLLTRAWAAVPLRLVQPFSPDYNPSRSRTWEPVFQHVVQRMREGTYPNLTTYQRGEQFITSDDYLAYYAYVEVAPTWVPCYILGELESAALRSVRPAAEELARRDAEARGRDLEQSILLYEFHQREDIRSLNGHPPAEPRHETPC